MEPIGIYLIHDCQLLTEAFADSLEKRPEVRLLGMAQDLEQALTELPALPVDLVLIDASSCDGEAGEVILEVWERLPELKILPLGVPSEDDVLHFLEAGASGYVLRQASFSELLDTIVAVHRGEPPCSPQIATGVCARIVELSRRKSGRRNHQHAGLTPREAEVLQLVAGGLSNKEIGQRLGITLPTVKNHIHHILDKLQVRGRRQAIRRAFENGLLKKPFPAMTASGPFHFA